jgi:hypothetical protein
VTNNGNTDISLTADQLVGKIVVLQGLPPVKHRLYWVSAAQGGTMDGYHLIEAIWDWNRPVHTVLRIATPDDVSELTQDDLARRVTNEEIIEALVEAMLVHDDYGIPQLASFAEIARINEAEGLKVDPVKFGIGQPQGHTAEWWAETSVHVTATPRLLVQAYEQARHLLDRWEAEFAEAQ